MDRRNPCKFSVAFFAVAILTVALCGCGGGGGGSASPGPEPRGATVTGTVLDAATGGPVAGASIAVGTRGAVTADDGTYTVSNVPTGSQELHMAAAGYEEFPTNSSPTFLVTVSLGTTTLDDILLVPAGQLPPALP